MSRLLDDYAAVVDRKSGQSLEATILRTRSRAALDVLAYLATTRQHGFDKVQKHLEECRHSPSRAGIVDLEPLDPSWTSALARTIAVQNLDRRDRLDALTLYRYLSDVRGPSSLPQRHAEIFAQLLFEQSKHAELHRYLGHLPLPTAQRAALQADLVNPFLRGAFAPSLGSIQTWLVAFATVLGRGVPGLGFTVGSGGSSPFDRLCSTGERAGIHGPLISVIVPCYRPDQGLRTAVASICQQTWEDTEVLIVDDGSPYEFQELISEVEASDTRVRAIRMSQNGGAYRARNAGLHAARGEFITVQDSDDWSHPDRLECQARPLIEDSRLIATRSRCVRVDDDLVINHVGYRPLRQNASSLLFRASIIESEIGYFDDGVRKGADGEYHLRILARFGSSSIEDLKEPLALVRRSLGSLSRSEFGPGWRHSARTNYRAAYRDWHERIVTGADAFLAAESRERPFPAPLSFASSASDRRPHFDLVFLGDWRQLGGPQWSMLEEIRAALDRGLIVGISHVEALRFMTRREQPLCRPIRELIADERVHHLLFTDEANVDLLLVRYPPILQFPPHAPTQWRVTHSWVVANQAPSERDGSDLRYLVTDCTSHAERLFGSSCSWVPQGPTVRRALDGLLPSDQMAPFDNPGVIDPADWYTEHRPWDQPIARAGRYSRDNAMKFPANGADLLLTYEHPDVSVTMMGATQQVPRLLDGRTAPESWTLLGQGEVPTPEFLRGVDFFVYYDNPVSNEAFGRSVLEAIASGCVVILPPHFEPAFHEAALYRPPAEAMSTVLEYRQDAHAFSTQVDRARKVVLSQFSHAAFVSRISPFVPALLEQADGAALQDV